MSTTEKSSAVLTDAEIKQALECCISCGDCEDCPMQTTSEECIRNLFRESLNIINRQQAEIERLTQENERWKADYEALKADEEREHQYCKNVCEPKYKLEIERLKKQLDLKGLEYTLLERDRAKDICDFAEELKTIKAATIKEFAEKLCEGRVSNDPVVIAVKTELKMAGDA